MHIPEEDSVEPDAELELTTLIETSSHLPPQEMAAAIIAAFELSPKTRPALQPEWPLTPSVGEVWESKKNGMTYRVMERIESNYGASEVKVRIRAAHLADNSAPGEGTLVSAAFWSSAYTFIAPPQGQQSHPLPRVGQVWVHYGTGHRCKITKALPPEPRSSEPRFRREWLGEARGEDSSYPLTLSSLLSGYKLVTE